ncbi:trans-sialidase, putative [Trypanosoma cruzi marinkellei]|uniref:Trans-sialidase, putative n=1 Tax=Trypanosoma cruzi marinkellei TaxID=85056 RepID=K2MRC7_TRYCR|nr:trans-sialidase, putative [Trypanosoma cruzi marinkellei]
MLSRVAAVKAPRTHNRRRVTGSSGKRRGEGRESEPQRPNMPRRVFTSAVLLFLVVMMCCGTGGAASSEVGSSSGDAQLPQEIALLVPQKTQVETKLGTGQLTLRDSFPAPSLACAGGLITAFAEGDIKLSNPTDPHARRTSVDIVAGYINTAEDWSSFVAEVNDGKWKARTLFNRPKLANTEGVALRPTAVADGNKMFLLVGSYILKDPLGPHSEIIDQDISLIVGEVTQSMSTSGSGVVEWETPISLLQQIKIETEVELVNIFGGGGTGIVMSDGTIVLSLSAALRGNDVFFIIYSKDNGKNWIVTKLFSLPDCFKPRIIEWGKGSILMILDCEKGRKVYKSSDMGTTWTEAVGTLLSMLKEVSADPFGMRYLLGSIITANIEGTNLILYTQKGMYPSGERGPLNAFYLWATDDVRTFRAGPLSVDEKNNMARTNTLMYSDGVLYLVEARGVGVISTTYFARLIEELKMVRFAVRTWAELDASFSALSIPTTGLIGYLSNAASGETWIDYYLGVNATVTKNAVKVENGFRFTGTWSGAVWPVNSQDDNGPYTIVNHNFTLVVSLIIHGTPKGSNNPLLGATLTNRQLTNIIGLSYSMNGNWVAVLNGELTESSHSFEPEKEYQVALVLCENKGSVYVDGEVVGSSEKIPTYETRGAEVSELFFARVNDGALDDSDVTMTNVFLYNRPLSDDELKILRKIVDGSMRGGVSRVLLLLLGLWGIAALY